MYEAHFGLAELPFPTGQDPRYYVDTPPHRAAVLALLAGVERGDAFMLLTGEFGVGKTTIARRVLAQADRQRHRVVELTSLRIEGDELFDRIAEALGAPSVDAGQGQRALPRLLGELDAGGQDALVLVDEAQRLDVDSLDRLRELSTSAPFGKRGMVHLCLIGRTAPPGIEALRRLGRPLDVGTTVHIGPLDATGTRDYVLARLNRVGWMGRPSFDEGAFAQIHALTGGIPGRINRLCRHILLQHYMLRRDDVDAGAVRAVDDLLKSEFGGRPATPASPPDVAALPARELPAPAAARGLPEGHPRGGLPAKPWGLGAPASDQRRGRWIQGASLAVVLSGSGIGWYAMSDPGWSRAAEARIVAAWARAAQPAASPSMSVTPAPRPALAAASSAATMATALTLEAAAAQTIDRSPPEAGTPAVPPPATAAVPARVGPPARAHTAPTGPAALAPQALRGGAAEARLRGRRERAVDLRPARSTATPAACTLEGASLGLCRSPREHAPTNDAARQPAADTTPRTPPAGPARPPCGPTQAALGLCPDR